MNTTTIDISKMFSTREACLTFAEQCESTRDTYDGVSATHWSAWNRLAVAARSAAEAKS